MLPANQKPGSGEECGTDGIKPDKWALEWSKPRMIVHPVISLRAGGKWVGNPPGL